MDRDGFTKAMMHFKTVCGSNKLNPKVLFYDGLERNFYERAIHILRYNHIKPFSLKAGDSGNDQPNDNGPKINLEGLYSQSRINWQRQHVTLNLKNSHMNTVLAEKWRAFQLSSDPIIIN